MTGRIAALLVVPNGSHRPLPLAAAIATLHSSWEIGAVWCGDPQLRPRPDGVVWLDDAHLSAADEIALIAGDPATGEWRRAITVAERLLADRVDRVVLLWVGSVAIAGNVDPLVNTTAAVTLIARAVGDLANSDLVPTEGDLVEAGLYSTTVAVFGQGSEPALEWLATQLTGTVAVGPSLTRAAQLFGAEVCSDPSIGVGRWRWDSAHPALIDCAGYDSSEPWTLDPVAERPARIELLGHPERQAVMARIADQLAGERTALSLPGGLAVDTVVRQVVADSTTSPPPPWTAAADFRSWLAPRYWPALHVQRPDLQAAFPDRDGRSATDSKRCCKAAFPCDDVPLLVAPPTAAGRPVAVADELRVDGFNLVGYLTRHSG